MDKLSPDELNAALAEKLFGWTVFRTEHNGYTLDIDEIAYGFPPGHSIDKVPFVITDYLDYRGMGEVIEAMAKLGWEFEMWSGSGEWTAEFSDVPGGRGVLAEDADTAPRAVALAALSALTQETSAVKEGECL